MRTFKPGDYVRLKNEKIPAMIELLRVNEWAIHPNQSLTFKKSHNIIALGDTLNFYSYNDSEGIYLNKNELSIHDFLITALLLREGDGMRSDMSTPEQRKHIAQVLEKVGVNQFETYANRNNIDFKNSFVYDGKEWSTCEIYTIKTYIDYSEWCRRLNVEPISTEQSKIGNSSIIEMGPFINYLPDTEKTIHNYQMSYEESARAIHLHLKEFCDESLFYPNMIADASRKASEEVERLRNKSILNLPDGNTVDLTKPIEVSFGNDRWDNEAEYNYVGLNVLNEIVVENIEDHDLQIAVSIRNKPEPELKPYWYTVESIGSNNWLLGYMNDKGIVIDQNGNTSGCLKHRPAIVDGNPVYPPFERGASMVW